MTPFQLQLTGRVTRTDKARSDYFYLPFDLPWSATSLRVRYTYRDGDTSTDQKRESVIDLGLFDPRGRGFPGGAGFRGWSGSARSEFTLTEDWATPGYLPGPLPAGRYQVILGLYRISESGADYHVEIEANQNHSGNNFIHSGNDSTRSRNKLARPHFESELHWMRGDLQSHTHHSDAKGSPEKLVGRAQTLDLDFLAITDHNTVSHHPQLAELSSRDLLLIPGQECTTYYGHMNIWGTSRWCDFRCRSPEDLKQIIDRAHRQGALCSINHPKEGGPAWEYGFDLPVDALEVWQGPWPYRNSQSLALWERLLADGWRVPVVGGSDYHCPQEQESNLLRLGQPTTWVGVAERSLSGILHALARGCSTISAGPDGPVLRMRARSGAASVEMGGSLIRAESAVARLSIDVWRGSGLELRVIADGKSLQKIALADDSTLIEVECEPNAYVRAELVGDMARERLPANIPRDLDLSDWRWALTNPIYFR